MIEHDKKMINLVSEVDQRWSAACDYMAAGKGCELAAAIRSNDMAKILDLTRYDRKIVLRLCLLALDEIAVRNWKRENE